MNPSTTVPTRGSVEAGERAVPLHWRSAGVSLVLDCSGPLLPRVLYWGADLFDRAAGELAGLAVAATPQLVSNNIDEVVPFSVLPEQSVGWIGTPGLTGHRDGAAFSTAFTVRQVTEEPAQAPVSRRLSVRAQDAGAGLSLLLEIEMTESGLLRQRATLTNDAADSTFTLDGLLLTLPVPTEAGELLDFTGRHLRERIPQRQPFAVGTRLRENRRGRTGADASIILAAGTTGFGFTAGEVWGVHVAWSGNHRTLAERTSTGVSLLGGGELLLAGEVRLAPGMSYRSPWLYGSYGRGLDELSTRFHRYLRGRPQHPRSPRPVIINTWEAVYFDHDLAKLTALADAAAQVGAERSFSTTVGSGTAGTTTPGSVTGTSTRRSGRRGCTRSSTTCAAWGCSSGCGSSRRWSTPTRTLPVRTRTGSWPPAAGCRRRPASSRSSTSATPRRTPTSSSGSTRCCRSTTSATSNGTTTGT